ncbi:DUF3099 domain-containing protein [Corynebacterium callunae]|uniref:DUF3099 domain-containing protein n=1 Tax=Corynebacterium callunae TaxID=1721 RepID=UPI003982D212
MNQRKHRPSETTGASENSSSKRFKGFLHRREVLLITDKKRTPMQDLRHRKRLYNVIQAARIPLLVLAGVSWMMWHAWILAMILFIISVPLPWIAVVIANGHGEPRDPREKNVYKPALVREMNEKAQLEARRAAEVEQPRIAALDAPRPFEGLIIDADKPEDS